MATAKNAPDIETVKMLDGRDVEFVGKKQILKQTEITADGKVILHMDFRNGEARHFVLNPDLVLKFAAHGAEQKYGDEVAGLKKDDGSEADLDDKILAIEELHDRLTAGEWNVKREGGGMAGTSVLLQAIMKLKGLPIEKVKAFLKDKTHAEKVALRNSPALKPIVEEIEAAKAAKATSKVDTEALLAQIGE